MSSSTVFVAGSRKISRLPVEVKSRIDIMVEKGFQILIGDANGADKAVQRYLAEQAYRNVVVHCMENHCRNNVGNWPTRQVPAPRDARGFAYYSLKDRAMAEVAEFGLMLWDGKSKGTINNIVTLSRRNKPIVVYIAPSKSFHTVRALEDLKCVLDKGDPTSVERLVAELRLDVLARRAAG